VVIASPLIAMIVKIFAGSKLCVIIALKVILLESSNVIDKFLIFNYGAHVKTAK
jgi:hypothetical protein